MAHSNTPSEAEKAFRILSRRSRENVAALKENGPLSPAVVLVLRSSLRRLREAVAIIATDNPNADAYDIVGFIDRRRRDEKALKNSRKIDFDLWKQKKENQG